MLVRIFTSTKKNLSKGRARDLAEPREFGIRLHPRKSREESRQLRPTRPVLSDQALSWAITYWEKPPPRPKRTYSGNDSFDFPTVFFHPFYSLLPCRQETFVGLAVLHGNSRPHYDLASLYRYLSPFSYCTLTSYSCSFSPRTAQT